MSKELERKIENFINKQEKLVGVEELNKMLASSLKKESKQIPVSELNKLITESFLLTEKTFDANSFFQYFEKIIKRIKDGEEFEIEYKGKDSKDKQIKKALIDPKFIETIDSLKSDDKIKNYLADVSSIKAKYLPVIPLVGGKEFVALNQISKEPFTRKSIKVATDDDKQTTSSVGKLNSEDIKESLVVYFYNLFSQDPKHLDMILNKFQVDKNDKIKLNIPILSISDLYGNTDNLLQVVKDINSKPASSLDKQTILHSLSNAYALCEKWNPTGDQKYIIDRGTGYYNRIREKASKISGVPADKWNPSDVYIYKSTDFIDEVLSKTDEQTLISQYVEDKLNKVGINEIFSEQRDQAYGISLKESRAQHGKAGSFVGFGMKQAGLSNDDIKATRVDEKSRDIIKSVKSNTFKGTEELLNAYEQKYIDTKNQVLSLLKDEDYGIVKVIEGGTALVDKTDNSEADTVSETIQEIKKPTLQQLNFEIDKYVKKYESYKFFFSLLQNFNQIKKYSKVMEQYNNPLLALTAYAVGLSGFNPTFYKVQAKANGSPGIVTMFEGQDRLVMSNMESKIIDEDTYAGFKFEFNTQMGFDKEGAPKLYSTLLTFRFRGGPDLTVEVYKFEPEK